MNAIEKNKYQLFLERYRNNPTLYGMAIGFVADNGYVAVSSMSKEEYDASAAKDAKMLGQAAADELFKAAKDIVENTTPMMLIAIVGNEFLPNTYLQEVYGSRVSRGEAVCPDCRGNLFKDTEGGELICVKCGKRIPLDRMDTLIPKVSFHSAKRQDGSVQSQATIQFDEMTQFVANQGDEFVHDEELRSELRKKWAAYVLCNGIPPYTSIYDLDLEEVWDAVANACGDDNLPECWASKERFTENLSRAVISMDYDEDIQKEPAAAPAFVSDTMESYYKGLCKSCPNGTCAYNSTGECRYPMVFHRHPERNEDGTCRSNTDDELAYIVKFIAGMENGFTEDCADPSGAQLRALWTAYCLRKGLDVDTSKYDSALLTLWEAIPAALREAPEDANATEVLMWADYDSFDAYMCKHLV